MLIYFLYIYPPPPILIYFGTQKNQTDALIITSLFVCIALTHDLKVLHSLD